MSEPELPTSQRAKQKADTRERILLAASRLFEANGFAATRTQDIADAAGISHGSIFAHFKNRDELLLAVANQFLSTVDSVTRKCLRDSSSLESFLQAHLHSIARHELLFARLLQELHSLPKEVRSLVVEINSAVSTHLMGILGKDKNTVSLNSSEFYFLFNTWMGLITYYLLNRDLFTAGPKVLEERSDEIIRLFLKLVVRQKGRKI